MTLVEILVVLSLIALLAGASVMGMGGIGSSRLRGAATTIVALSRVAITRTNATGRPVRLVLDLEKNQVWLEESESSRALRTNLSDEDAKARADKKREVEERRLLAVKADAEADAERLLEGKSGSKAAFVRVEKLEIAGEKVGVPRELGSSIEFRQVHVEHDGEPRTSGTAYLFFWPGGETEWASIQLRRSGEQDGLTVLVSPLTGRARIERGSVELPKPAREGEIDEVEGES
jgi:general secretion pathway protein H